MEFWSHYCTVDKAMTDTLVGEPCTWCDAREDSISALEQDVAYLEFEIKKAKEQVKELEQMLMLRKLSK